MKRYFLLYSIVISLLVMACNLDPSFDEYDDEDFLSQTTWSDWALMPDYSFESGTSAGDYMDFSQVSGESGPNGGEVYRLEIKNLLQNGDFSNGTSTLPWKYYDAYAPAIPTTTIPNTNIMEIVTSSGDNKADFSLSSDGDTIEERLLINPYSDFISSKTYVGGKIYLFSFNYELNSSTDKLSLYFFKNWNYSDNTLPSGSYITQELTNFPSSTIPITDPENPENITPNYFTSSSTGFENDYLGFAKAETQLGKFDDFRIIRSPEGDFDLRLRLKMDIDHRSDLELISGYYRFSVWVKQADLTGLSNKFPADRIELGIRGYDEDNQLNVDDVKVFYKTQALADEFATSTGTFSGDWSSGWVQLVLESENLVQLPNVSTDPVFELSISPSNPGGSDSSWNRLSPGTILIAEPSLEYSETSWN